MLLRTPQRFLAANVMRQLKRQHDKKNNMKKLVISIFILATLTSCDLTTNKTKNMEEQKKQSDESLLQQNTTPKVTGIGGIFFYSDNPEKIKEWYEKNLGLAIDDYGSAFEFRNANRPNEVNYLRWSPFKNGSEYFNPSKKDFMINYRVQNIEGLVNKLRNNGVTILDSIETYDYGKFIHIMDAEGNKIELWEPVDSVLTKMGGKTTK